MMKCVYCQGRMERKTAPFQINRKGYHLTIDQVPAWVCVQCGEVYFEEQEANAIQEAINAIDEKTEKFHKAA